MKAILLAGAGGTEQLQYTTLPVPEPGPGEVRLRVRALSVNPVDVKTRKGGAFFSKLQEAPPAILGWDVSGVVDALGEGVAGVGIGDALFGMINFPGSGRCYAEYVVAPVAHLARKPEAITHEAAAATTLAALTAWQVLVHEAGLQRGQRVLVHAAAGGVGHFAVQIARHLGATVVGTASTANQEFLRTLGVDEPVDYSAVDIRDAVVPVDVVLDPIGGDTTLQSLRLLRPGGILVSIVGGAKEPVLAAASESGVTAKNYLVHSSGADMEALAGLLSSGALKPQVESRFPFEEMAAAHAQIETGRTRGKVIVLP
ncbi:NADP-dependent oxidoreductase [Flaviaesturariibacter amylovorans]|uniref:NADP-dependent oxidoreductase n=1 Tax=Flaviaesturariibacter amylovorans TaxID=1084520 RepID=A0ABP8HB34_9BACT